MKIADAILQKPRHREQARDLYRYSLKLAAGKRKVKATTNHK
jgi:hypothetical protein